MAVAAVLLAPQAAAAATPWLDVSQDRYASFTVPAAYVQEHVGTVSQVVVEGNFGPSSTLAEFGLTRRGDVWSGILGPLKPGLYHYQVTADDTKSLKDPTNSTSVASNPLWSTVLVPGDSARWLADAPPGTGGKVETLTYRTRSGQRSALVWTPPGYAAKGPKGYPALFLQSGEGAATTDWLDLGRAKQIFDNLSAQGAMKPMVVVINDDKGSDDKELKDLRKAVANSYRVLRDPAHQAIAGVSDGATQAVRAALTNAGPFAYVGWFSGDSAPKSTGKTPSRSTAPSACCVSTRGT
ncbi:alpha/beta hydrolase-fold protein [Micromonospora sp. NBC_01638]|uniref:alpha/beta hydrolase-fold protein n=1 Tax=Micromonospora sp. NBC_01638 TaxID=2975982 RepID=UPI003865F195|nr:alpha/beta hydrolase-fold protein [Micromonospora sp. NBC_01638]